MPDLPQQGGGAPAPGGAPQGQPPQGGGGDPSGGGGIAQAITMVDATVYKIAQAVAANKQLPDDVKQAWNAALTALRAAEQALIKAAGGNGQPDSDEEAAGGATTTQQGGNGGAVPVSHQNMRGQ